MRQAKVRKIISIVLCVVSVILLILGGINLPKQKGSKGNEIVETLRLKALLFTTGESVVESYVDIAKKEAQQRVKGSGGSMSEIRNAVEQAEADTRAMYSNVDASFEQTDTTALKAVVSEYYNSLVAYGDVKKQAEEEYKQLHYDEAVAALEAKHQAMLDAGEVVPEDEEAVVDMSGFVPTQQMESAKTVVDSKYEMVGNELKVIYPVLDEESLQILQDTIQTVIYQPDDDFVNQFDRYVEKTNSKVSVANYLIRHGDDIIYFALFLVIIAMLLLFYEKLISTLGVPRVIIGLFFILLCFMTLWYDLSLSTLLSNTVVRMGMNAIMVLAMVPGIQCGISLNLGLPIGLVAGLIGGLVTIEFDVPGWSGFFLAIAIGVVIAIVSGYLYALLLNRLKGDEMSVTTYVGFSIVSLMCIAWLVLPFKSLKLRWPLGTGLRNTIGLDSSNFKHILNNFLAFSIGDFVVPTGLLLFMALCCLLVWLFSRSKTGEAMQAVGNNPRFAESTGINVDKMRIVGTVLSTVLGAVGILVYSQSYGFMQLYTAPRQMGFIAASAILIGGATTSRCKISHVIIGTFLFQGVLTLGMPVANVLVPGSTISETLRILISNGIILYALTKSGGGSRA